MKIVKKLEPTSRLAGTTLKGRLTIDYKILVSNFGKPEPGFYKTDAEWHLEAPDGTVINIYNYKSGRNYLGAEGLAKTEIRDWYIGGFKRKAVGWVNYILKKNKKGIIKLIFE